jgi:pimeloyl-ACP methyl ester carboxylesterase
VTGTLGNWSVLDSLAEITVPVLLLNGKYDEAQDSCLSAFFVRLRKVQWVQFSESARMSHFEERERFMKIVGEFLADKIEA